MRGNGGFIGIFLLAIGGIVVLFIGFLLIIGESPTEFWNTLVSPNTAHLPCPDKMRPKDTDRLSVVEAKSSQQCRAEAYGKYAFEFPETWSIRLATSANQENVVFNENKTNQVEVKTFGTRLSLEQLPSQEFVIGGQRRTLIDTEDEILDRTFTYLGNKRVLRIVTIDGYKKYVHYLFIGGAIRDNHGQKENRGVMIVFQQGGHDTQTAVENMIISFN